jgi:DNA-binding response OmpR family regulator
MKCPVCEGELKDIPLQWFPDRRAVVRGNLAVVFPPMQARIFAMLWRANGSAQNVKRAMLYGAVWGDHPDGGPLSDALAMHVSKMRKKLAPLDMEVECTEWGWGDRGGYRLVVRHDGDRVWQE